jgi:hypothetical protein
MQKRTFFLYLVVFLIFLLKGSFSLDPDFGWRLKAGEIYINAGIPKTDPFTYTMPSYPWVDHAWLQSAGIAATLPIIGKVGLAALYTLLAILAVTLAFYRNEEVIIKKNLFLNKYSLSRDFGIFGSLVFLLSIYIIFIFYGVRVQVVSWLMLSILLKVIFDQKVWERWRMFLPVFFILWANLHGSFALGILVLFLVLIIRSVGMKSIDSENFVIAVVCLFVTLANPYRIGVWREVWSSVSDSDLRWTIYEWMPALMMFNILVAFSIVLFTVFVWKHKEIYEPEEIILYFFFLISAITSRRHLPLWIIVALPLVIRAIHSFYLMISKIKNAKDRFRKAYKLTWFAILIVLGVQLLFDFRNVFYLKEENFYPKDAISYLRQNLPRAKIFSKYGWGGYLIWKIPEKKVFIDGRMPSWRWKDNPSSETGSALDDYNDLLAGDVDYKNIFAKYGINTLLWSVSTPRTFFEELSSRLENFMTIFGWEKKDFDLLSQLEEDGWQKVYEDSTAIVYKKPE